MQYKNLSFRQRLGFALQGIRQAWKAEKSLRFQSLAALGLFVFCAVVRPPLVWCALFAAMAAMVLALELVNSAVEAILDRLHPERNASIGFAKDCLAGAALVASLASVLVFALYLWSAVF
ncbi:diacylglycerol kinase [Pseudorhodoferax sp.]|uniref:diacylglycerol kinase n=1 Tax=Pseudorhodoferax sp. TaxID=1993553 RepID=UPI0039E6EF76